MGWFNQSMCRGIKKAASDTVTHRYTRSSWCSFTSTAGELNLMRWWLNNDMQTSKVAPSDEQNTVLLSSINSPFPVHMHFGLVHRGCARQHRRSSQTNELSTHSKIWTAICDVSESATCTCTPHDWHLWLLALRSVPPMLNPQPRNICPLHQQASPANKCSAQPVKFMRTVVAIYLVRTPRNSCF